MESQVSAVIVDYAEVVSAPPNRDCTHAMAKVLGLEQGEFQRLYATSREFYDRGQADARDYWQQFASTAGVMVTPSQIEKLRRLDVETWRTVDPRMIRWLRSLREAGVKTALLSNMIPDLAIYARRTFEWIGDLTCCVLSCEVGLAKPDRAIYQRCLTLLRVRPGETLFIDDRAINIQAARELGMIALQFRSVEQLRDYLSGLQFPVQPLISELGHETAPNERPLSSAGRQTGGS